MFEGFSALFRHDGAQAGKPVQPSHGGSKSGRMPASPTRDQAGGRAPITVGDSRFLITNGMFQGARRWM